MLKFVSTVCATAMALSVPFAAPAIAMPTAAPAWDQQIPTNVQFRTDEHGREIYVGPGGHRYWRGHRGYRDYRPGYHRHGDFWFPAAAFIAGALITGAITSQQPRVIYRSSGNAHTEWCYSRYRSYRAYDNTFQPYHGPRRQCYSPYS